VCLLVKRCDYATSQNPYLWRWTDARSTQSGCANAVFSSLEDCSGVVIGSFLSNLRTCSMDLIRCPPYPSSGLFSWGSPCSSRANQICGFWNSVMVVAFLYRGKRVQFYPGKSTDFSGNPTYFSFKHDTLSSSPLLGHIKTSISHGYSNYRSLISFPSLGSLEMGSGSLGRTVTLPRGKSVATDLRQWRLMIRRKRTLWRSKKPP
jgi:hypothetical protein